MNFKCRRTCAVMWQKKGEEPILSVSVMANPKSLIIVTFGRPFARSHVVSSFSGKPIFGQSGPKYIKNILKHSQGE